MHVSCSIQNKADARNYIGKFIENEVKKISLEEVKLAYEKNYHCVLIIGQSQYLKQIYSYLKNRFANVDFEEHQDEEIELIEGYKLLISDERSNLGWRIIVESTNDGFKHKIIKTIYTSGSPIIDLLDPEFISSHLAIVKILKKLINDEVLLDKEVKSITERFSESVDEIKSNFHESLQEKENINKDNPTIKLTTINGSKGMSGGFVFILNMNNGDFPKNPNKLTDHEICQFIVALTRTRKQCYLISNQRFGVQYGIKPSIFINWIGSENIIQLDANAEYFKNLSNQAEI